MELPNFRPSTSLPKVFFAQTLLPRKENDVGSCRQIGEVMTLGKVAPGGAPALAPVKTAHQGVSTDAPPRATRSHFTYLPT